MKQTPTNSATQGFQLRTLTTNCTHGSQFGHLHIANSNCTATGKISYISEPSQYKK